MMNLNNLSKMQSNRLSNWLIISVAVFSFLGLRHGVEKPVFQVIRNSSPGVRGCLLSYNFYIINHHYRYWKFEDGQKSRLADDSVPGSLSIFHVSPDIRH